MSYRKIDREVDTHKDGSRSITDTSYDKTTGKIRSHIYNINPDSSKHDHSVQEYDEKSYKYIGGHSEDKRPWRDLFLSYLGTFSFEDLQIIEAKSTNEYVKNSARNLINAHTYEEEIGFQKILKRL